MRDYRTRWFSEALSQVQKWSDGRTNVVVRAVLAACKGRNHETLGHDALRFLIQPKRDKRVLLWSSRFSRPRSFGKSEDHGRGGAKRTLGLHDGARTWARTSRTLWSSDWRSESPRGACNGSARVEGQDSEGHLWHVRRQPGKPRAVALAVESPQRFW